MDRFDKGASTIPALQPAAPTVLQRHHLNTFAEALFSQRSQYKDSMTILVSPRQKMALDLLFGSQHSHSRGRRKNGRERRAQRMANAN